MIGLEAFEIVTSASFADIFRALGLEGLGFLLGDDDNSMDNAQHSTILLLWAYVVIQIIAGYS